MVNGTLFCREYWAPTMCTRGDGDRRHDVMSVWAVFSSQTQTHRWREMETLENLPNLDPSRLGTLLPLRSAYHVLLFTIAKHTLQPCVGLQEPKRV